MDKGIQVKKTVICLKTFKICKFRHLGSRDPGIQAKKTVINSKTFEIHKSSHVGSRNPGIQAKKTIICLKTLKFVNQAMWDPGIQVKRQLFV